MIERLPDSCNPQGEHDKRQRQRQTDQFQGRGVPAAGGQGGFSCPDRGGIGFTHVYTIAIRQRQQRPRGSPRPLPLARNSRLFQRAVDRGELGVQVGPLTTAMIASEMPAAIRPYSIAVAPDSSFTKTRNQVLH